jgi:hypothetical protein
LSGHIKESGPRETAANQAIAIHDQDEATDLPDR